jgi:hypothetical protein
VASAKAKAIGTPANTQASDHADEEDHQVELAQRLQARRRPSQNSDDERHHVITIACTTVFQSHRSAAAAAGANSAISAMPIGSAAARQALAISSAGVTMKRSSSA